MNFLCNHVKVTFCAYVHAHWLCSRVCQKSLFQAHFGLVWIPVPFGPICHRKNGDLLQYFPLQKCDIDRGGQIIFDILVQKGMRIKTRQKLAPKKLFWQILGFPRSFLFIFSTPEMSNLMCSSTSYIKLYRNKESQTGNKLSAVHDYC